jgi:hypothetical protein
MHNTPITTTTAAAAEQKQRNKHYWKVRLAASK